MKVSVVSGLSSTNAPHIPSTYFGTKLLTVGFPELKVNADKNSRVFKGRFANAIQLKMHLIRSTDRGSS